MNYRSRAHRFGWLSRLAVAAVAILLLPMGPGRFAARPGRYALSANCEHQSGRRHRGVDPGLREITVTFDRDMNEQGMSWTGGGDEFPKIDESRKAAWKDARTCLLPVKLEKGTFYRVGINSTSFRNFQSSDGTPALPSVIYFTTPGGDRRG